ncbi:MAG TPA: DNA gyrase subunit A [Terriglobales bacterium]|nr:DNA gyrase subunit A [Terriglobales bacterium]
MADDQNPQNPQLPLPGDGQPPQGPGAANIQPVNIEEEMRRSYLDYSMSVIIGRALPDVRDGLKPVHRRILYAMHDMGVLHNRKHIKCAGVVGELLKKYHPHGDGAVYDALVRLAQPWSMRYPLVDGQGNFGSIDGDSAAAYRYTECRMTAIAEEMLADIDKDAVDYVANFDETTMEPVVLPTKIPNLIINGSNGIAVGMATNIPPHNLTEIVDATILLVNDPKTQLPKILEVVKGPDFPTGAYIYGKAGIAEAYKTGRGRFVMRAKAAIENITKDKQAIVVTEIPYQVNKSTLVKRIADLVNDKTIDDVSDVRDESDRSGMRVVVELKRGAQPEIILNQLHKHTQMQESFSMIFLAVVNGQPRELGLIPAIQHFIDHRVDVVRRRTAFLLMKAREREHILEGYKIALDNLDAVIKLIRGSASRQDAKDALLAARFKITDKEILEKLVGREGKLTARQADAILELQLYRLTRLSADEILNELKDIREKIAEYESILASEKKLRGVIVKELEEIKKQYGDARRTQILDEAAEIQLEDLIQEEQVAVTVTHSGYLKRTPISTYRQQRRGGTGRKGAGVREEDFVEHLFVASTHAYLLIFTNTGRVYWLKVYEVPDVGAAGKGKHVSNLVALQPGESVRAMLPVRDLEREDQYVFFATRQGTVKKTPLVDFSNVMSRGIIAIGIEKEDELVAAQVTDGKQIVFLASHEGMAIRFEEDDVRPMGRPAYGVRGMDLDKGDYIVGMAVTSKEPEAVSPQPSGKKNGKADDRGPSTVDEEEAPTANLILSVTENGYGKRTGVDEYRLQSRGGKGVINVKTTERNGRVVGILLVSEKSEAMLISQYGKIIRMDTGTIREAGRSTQGVRLLSMEGGDKVAAAVVIPPEETNGNGNGTPSLIQ